MTSKTSGLAVVVVVILAMGLAGTQAIGLHKQCIDGLDNDGDVLPGEDPMFATDFMDYECLDYPFADGNGETATPITEQFNSIGVAYHTPGYDTAFNWWESQKVNFAISPSQQQMINAMVSQGWTFVSITCPMIPPIGTPPGVLPGTWDSYPSIEGSYAAQTAHIANNC